MECFIENDRTEEVGSVSIITSEIPFLTEDMIDAAMNKHLNYQIKNGKEHWLNMEEESLDSEECWISHKRSSYETKDSDHCDINKSSDTCSVKRLGSVNEVINNSNNSHSRIKLNDVQNNSNTCKADEKDISELDKNNRDVQKEYRQAQKNSVQSDTLEIVKATSEHLRSIELKGDAYQVVKNDSCLRINKQCENKTVDVMNCNSNVIGEKSPSESTDCENAVATARSKNELFYDGNFSSGDDSYDEDIRCMRLDDELKKAIENNLIKEIGSAFNINSSDKIYNDNNKFASVNDNKQHCETLASCNSVKANVECENEIMVHSCGSNSTVSEQLCSSDKLENVNIHNVEEKETISESVLQSTGNSQDCNTSNVVTKSSYFRNKQHKFETLTTSQNILSDESDTAIITGKIISFQSSKNGIIDHEDFSQPSCSYRKENSTENYRKGKILASTVTKASFGKYNTPKVIVIKKHNLLKDDKVCNNSQILKSKNLLLVSPTVTDTSQKMFDKNPSSTAKSSLKVVPIHKNSAGVIQTSLNENFIETVFQRQILISQIPAYSSPGLTPTKAFKCDYCGDRFSMDCSLKHHLNRHSVEISYWCRVCCLNMQFYNRCKLINHLKTHGQHIKNIDSSCVTMKPLPKHLVDLGLTKYLKVDSTSELKTIFTKEQDKTKSQNDTIETVDCRGQTFGKSDDGNGKQRSILSVNTECFKEKTDSNRQTPKAVVLTIPAYKFQHISPKSKSCNTVQNSKVILLTKITSDKMESSGIGQRSENIQGTSSDTFTSSEINEYSSCLTVEGNEKGNNFETMHNNRSDNEITVLKTADKQANSKKNKFHEKGSYCNKCKHSFIDIVNHLNNGNRPINPEYTCASCQLILPTECALWFHMKIHTKIPPFKCPECGKDFRNFDLFSIHLKYICGHLSKIVTYVCSLCDTYYMNLTSLKSHIYNLHSVNIYKCNLCSYAFFSPNSLSTHKKQRHPNERNVSFGSYRQCKMCPDRLVPKAKIADHVNYHSRQSKHCTYQYKCYICQLIINGKEDFLTHQSKCLNNELKQKKVLKQKNNLRENSREKSVEFVQSESVDTDCTVIEEEIMLNKDVCNDIAVVPEKDPLSLEDWEDCEEDIVEETVETCVVCKEQPVIFVPGTDRNSQSLCCKQCVRPCFPTPVCTSQSIEVVGGQVNCGYDEYDIEMLSDGENKIYHKKVGQKRRNDVHISNPKRQKLINSVTFCQSSKEIKFKNGVEGIQCQKLDTTKNKKHKRKQGKLDTRGERKPPTFPCGQIVTANERSSGWACCKCQFETDSTEDFREHVIQHRTDPDDFQCLECGLCFVVQPSLEKHLLFQHQIKDIKDYIAKNNVCDRIKQESDAVIENQCCVCFEIFDSKLNLDLHFRTHGMAFLSKNKRDISC